jgi:hypothetical protein
VNALRRVLGAVALCAVLVLSGTPLVAPGRAADIRLRAAAPAPPPIARRVVSARPPRLRSRAVVVSIPAIASITANPTPSEEEPVVEPLKGHGIFTEIDIRAGVSLTRLPRQAADVPLRAPRALVPLYITFGGLQALDYHSTTRGLCAGAVEANPVAGVLQKHPAGIIAAKAAVTAGVIVAGEKLWKRNRVGAVVFMTAMNAGMAAAVAHNYHATHTLRGRQSGPW